MIGGLSVMAPERRDEIVSLGLKSIADMSTRSLTTRYLNVCSSGASKLVAGTTH